MKHLKNFNELNELNTDTYRSAAKKLQDKHPGRAKDLNDFADERSGVDETILIHGDIEVTLSDIEYYPDERLFSTNKNNNYIEVYKLNGKTWISDRKSAMKFKKMLLAGNFKIEESFDKNDYAGYFKAVKDRMETTSINDMYTTI